MVTRILLVGGFLGAGKTTLLLQAAHLLMSQGYRVGLITNDQGQDVVDTALARQQKIPVVEVAGGCFCCRFPDLLASIRHLQETVVPDIVLAEPVGSCTDLAATVLRPLHSYYPDQFLISPLTVLLDPQRELSSFPDTVDYLYHKQLAEANIIVLNKSDLLDPLTTREKLYDLKQSYPNAQVMSLSARTGAGLAEWLELSLSWSGNIEQMLDLDYSTYAEAEACLGWLNAKGELVASQPFSATTWLTAALNNLEKAFAAQGASIAHVKAHLATPELTLKASLTELGSPISWDTWSASSETERADFILNARVNADPQTLEAIVRKEMTQVTPDSHVHFDFTHLECFSPLPPQPTYRLSSV